MKEINMRRKTPLIEKPEIEENEIIICNSDSITVDPFGSYTGVVLDNPNDMPIQDVDDL